MAKHNSLLSSLALSIGLTLGISTTAIAYPINNHRVRQSGIRVIHPSRAYEVTPSRYQRNRSPYNSRYNRNRDRNYYGRDYYDDVYYDDCRDGRRGRRRRRRRRNITITNPPIYRNNLPFPNYIKIRTVR